MTNETEFLEMLKAAFQVEAAEHVQTLNEGIVELEGLPLGAQFDDVLETIFREAHTLKGAARAVDYEGVEKGCQWLEDVFSSIKAGEITATQAVFASLYEGMNQLQTLLSRPPSKGASFVVSPLNAESPKHGDAPAKRPITEHEGVMPTGGQPIMADRSGMETVRIPPWKLDELFRHAEEMLSAKLTATQRASEMRDVFALLEPCAKRMALAESSLRSLQTHDFSVSSDEADVAKRLHKLAEHLDAAFTLFGAIKTKIALLEKSTQQDSRSLGGLVGHLLEQTKGLMLVPCSGLLAVCPKVVRDLALEQNKEIELTLLGQEVEIDKRIIDEMRKLLLHLVRNAIDHGIEQAAERVASGKLPKATLKIAVSQTENNRVEILIQDDGRGIQIDRVKAQAVKVGILSQEEANKLSDTEAAAFIFHSGLSTKSIITDISGRGLGMAIVRERIDKLGGQVFIETALGKGTAFRISLPVSMSTFEGILVQASGQLFVLPSSHVDYVTRVSQENIHSLAHRQTVCIKGRNMPLVPLEDLLGLPHGEHQKAKRKIVLVLAIGEARLAVSVSAIISEHEVVVKPLGYPLLNVRNIAGVTVIGTGKSVLVLRVEDLISTAKSYTPPREEAADQETTVPQKILIAEDSITSRMLIKNILETGGFEVVAAVDGLEAWNLLNAGEFAAVVSDVDMPHMTGFELTAKIRAEKKYGNLPVMLVTARETEEDRERGVDVGASAYIVKRNFEESNLLKVLRRLI